MHGISILCFAPILVLVVLSYLSLLMIKIMMDTIDLFYRRLNKSLLSGIANAYLIKDNLSNILMP